MSTRPNSTLSEAVPTVVSAAFFKIANDGTTTLYPLPEEVPTAVGPASVPRSPVLLAAPNPFAGQTSILLTLPKAQDVFVSISDVSGRQVWQTRTHLAAGQHRIPWFGQDDAGRKVSAGTYFVHVRGENGMNLRKTVIRLR